MNLIARFVILLAGVLTLRLHDRRRGSCRERVR